MTFSFLLIAVLLAAVGHAFVWIGLVNRLHALGIPRRIVSILTAIFFLSAAMIPPAIGWWFWRRGEFAPLRAFDAGATGFCIGAYVLVCWIVAPVTLARGIYLRMVHRTPAIVRWHRRRPVALDLDAVGSPRHDNENNHHFLVRLPWNESLDLNVAEWTIDVPRMPPALDGMSIVHLSDLHLSGRVGKVFFHEVARVCNELRPDLIALTGDLAETPTGVEWLPDVLGRLSAPSGVFFILGNHDLHVGAGRHRELLRQCGLIDLGGQWRQMEVRGAPIILAGNERPWIGQAPDFSQCPSAAPEGPMRIVLSHSPDQFAWAKANRIDLLLAGHTHGGQIRIPPFGAILTPTIEGVKYVSGIYHEPPTILHVTHGVSGDVPFRWNCRPEISFLRLRAAGRP